MSAGRKHISDKKDWNTPPKYIKQIKKMFGVIDLDPCSNEHSMVDAETKYILPINGLVESWDYKRIFVNPPYGRNGDGTTIYDWINKGVESAKLGNEILYLIPVATNTKHFKNLIFKHANGLCFLEDTRLKFWNNGNEDKKGAPMACCMIYFGNNYDEFLNVFSAVGKCFKISAENNDTKKLCSITANVWCYEQVCLRRTFNLAQNLLANLLIARVSSRFLFIN